MTRLPIHIAAWNGHRSSRLSKLDPQTIRVAVLLVLVAILNMVDLHYTLFAHRQGLLRELNPLAAPLFSMELEPSVVCLKALTVLTGSWMMWRARKSPWAGWACWLLVAVYLGLAFYWVEWAHTYSEIARLHRIMATPVHIAMTH